MNIAFNYEDAMLSGGKGYNNVELFSSEPVAAVDSFGHITAANPGEMKISLSVGASPDLPDNVEFTVFVKPSTSSEAVDAVESYSIDHVNNNSWYGETDYWYGAVENPPVYNCFANGSNRPELYKLTMKRNTTGDSFKVSDAAIIAELETVLYDEYDYYGETHYGFSFEVLSYKINVTEIDGGLSSETTVMFAAHLPGSTELELSEAVSLTLNCVDTPVVNTVAAGIAEGVAADVAGKVKSPEGSSYGVDNYLLLDSIPASALDDIEEKVDRIETSVECTVNKFDEANSKLKVDLEPVYTVYGENNVKLVQESIPISETVPVEIDVNELGVYESGPVSVKHIKDDGAVYYYDGVISEDGILRFENPNGFSEFEIEKKPVIAFHNLVLSGEIGLNFFMDLPTIEGVDYNESYMEFTVSGDPIKVYYDSENNKEKDGKTYYRFTCYLNALEMAESVTAVFHYGDKTVEQEYSVTDYINTFEEHEDEFQNADKELIYAIEDYSHYSQKLLAETHHLEPGTDYIEMPAHSTYSSDMYSSSMTETEECEILRGTNSDIAKVSFSLDLLSKTSIFVYFTPAENYSGSINVTVGGYDVQPELRSDGRYRIKIPNISAHTLMKKYSVVATTENGSATTVVCALSYVYAALNGESSSDNLKNFAVSLYQYYSKNIAYRNAHSDVYN